MTDCQPTCRYLTEFIRLNCAADLMAMKIFPNAKEITESFAAYSACRKHVPFNMADPSVTVYCIGDGVTPRTGATFAYRTKWQVVSIDPKMRNKGAWAGIERLSCVTGKAEDFIRTTRAGKVLVVAVHSHANLEASVEAVARGSYALSVIAIPCCKPQDLIHSYTGHILKPGYEYEDFGIWSPKRTVKVWTKMWMPYEANPL